MAFAERGRPGAGSAVRARFRRWLGGWGGRGAADAVCEFPEGAVEKVFEAGVVVAQPVFAGGQHGCIRGAADQGGQ
jgi:hypothetical protein